MLRILLFVLFAATALPKAVAQEPMPGKQVEQQFVTAGKEISYLLFLPAGYEKAEAADKQWPMLVFLHGAGERGLNLDLVKKHGPPRIVETKPEFGFVVVSPQCPQGTYWNIDDVMKVIDQVQNSCRVDTARVYLTGLSMGGYGSWALAAKYPDRFAAVAPICGRGDPETAKSLLNTPIWAFHGDADKVVPVSGTTEVVAAIQQQGGKQIKMTIYQGVGHDSWTQTYDNPEFYVWLLKHRLEQHRREPKPDSDSAKTPPKKRPVASLDDLEWIVGNWAGEAMGGRFEESWSRNSFGSMMGMFKFVKDDQIAFYEFLTIVQKDETLLLRLKHFTPDLVGWESKEDSVEFPLISLSDREAEFDGLIFQRISRDEMHITVKLKDDGPDREIRFVCQRVKN